MRPHHGTIATAITTGPAGVQGRNWSARAEDWAAVQEGTLTAVFTRVLDELAPGADTTWLDVGCGSGQFAQLAAERKAQVVGLDAAPGLVAIAERRAPAARFHVGEMEELPFRDATFDVVTGFNSFQYAAEPVRALAEAKRVARPGAHVVVAIWGTSTECQAAGYIAALDTLSPPPPPGAPGPFALSAPGALEELVTRAGLKPERRDTVDTPWQYPNLVTALRGLLSGGPAVRAIETSGEPQVVEAVSRSIDGFRRPDGSYRIENTFHYLVARA